MQNPIFAPALLKCPAAILAGVLTTMAAHGQNITHRWSFNGTGASGNGTILNDSISSAAGTIVGNGAARNGTALTLPGGTNGNQPVTNISAYFDLPNGIISSKTNMTMEIWATVQSSRSWQRLIDFGRVDASANGGEISNTSGAPGGTSSSDNLMFAVQRGGNLGQQRLVGRLNGGGEFGSNNSVTITPGVQYHFAITFQSGVGANAATGGRLSWYRDGILIGSVDTNFRLNQIEDVNNWLGRSQYSGDDNANISYNEFRLYSGLLSADDIKASRKAGPDATIVPVTAADTMTVMTGGKVGMSVLANDSGQHFPSSVEIISAPVNGTASVLADGRILYTHVNEGQTTDSLTYRVRGGGGMSNISTVTITAQPSPKIANPQINVPLSPPTTALGLVNAFPIAGSDSGGLEFNSPLSLTTPPGDTKKLFVLEKGGVIRLVSDVTAATPSSVEFFNLGGLVTARANEDFTSDGECGLLGLAFHPNYATNRKFYVFYSVVISGQRNQRVSCFLTHEGNPNAAKTDSELILIQQPDDFSNHNGGDLHFGPDDGYLYISVGDEGNGDDNPTFNSQLINKDLFSGILRIDVDKKAGNVAPTSHVAIPTDGGLARFSIPVDNPFVNIGGGTWDGKYNGTTVTGTVRREFWATGLRNPWRMSFDPVTHELWCADVGQGAWEEVNKITRGGNYGWVFREGNHNGPRTTNPTMPANFDTLYHNRPVYEYPRGGELGGYSVTGGRVYRGTNIPSLTGKYIFGDFGSGNIWSLNLDGTGVQRIASEGGVAGFGYDPSNGDILLADLDTNRILRLATTTTSTDYPDTLSATGLFSDLSDLSPSPSVIPYSVNLPFWSDHAVKSRWVSIPDGTSRFTASPDGLWTFPTGTIWVKHFDMEMQRGVASSKKRIETRLIVKNSTGAYGVSYRWNEAGTEALLAADGGENFTLQVMDGATPVPQTWRIPSRSECMTCHTPAAGHALSFNTRQLNLEGAMFGTTGNQLVALKNHDYLTNDPGSPNLLPRHAKPDDVTTSIEARVRSYLAVNCSYCHKAGGTAPGSWDGSPGLALEQMGLINATASNSGSDPLNKLIVPGDPTHSIVLSRIAVTNGFSRMPPVGSNVIDQANVMLMTEWISGELANRRNYAAWRSAEFDPDNNPAGAPEMDADGDGISNLQEFLTGTDPNDGSSGMRPLLSKSANSMNLAFTLPVNRSFRIEASGDLGSWTPLDIPGNAGLPTAGGTLEFAVPDGDSKQFFRIQVREN